MIIKRLRYKLLLAFFSIFIISLISFLGSLYIYSKKNNITQVSRNIDDIRVLTFKNFKLVDDFLTYEVENELYFKTEVSEVKKEIEVNYSVIVARLKNNKTLLRNEQAGLGYIIDSIVLRQKEYLDNFDALEQLILKKGFKDYGIEGQMRLYAHKLMNEKNVAVKTLALMLRRHEKDFIIRKDIQYFNKYIQVYDESIAYINKNIKSENEKNELKACLINYRKYFTDYFNLQYEIGITENEGALFELNKKYNDIDKLFDNEKARSIIIEEQYSATLKYYNIIIISLSVTLSLVFSFFYSWQISSRAVRLKNSIESYINSGFKTFPQVDKEIKITELEVIAKGFNKMAIEINSYINFFKLKVEERTAEITKQKEEIEKQKILLSEKNKSFTDSILYAEKIQNAILPPLDYFKEEFTDSFIFYQPRDIVSGDFYWMETVGALKTTKSKFVLEQHAYDSTEILIQEQEREEQESKKILFAVADCTGHGVPGAFMSIVGHNHLDKIVNEYGVIRPSDILNHLNTGILSTLRQTNESTTTLKDGMDIAFCSFDTKRRTLKFAGANKDLYLVRENQLFEFKGNKKPIGVSDERVTKTRFEDVEIKIHAGDIVYLSTDGYPDQFGGSKNKKFKTRNLKNLLLNISSYNMHQQHNMIRNSFETWKGDNFQVDDVLVMGIKF